MDTLFGSTRHKNWPKLRKEWLRGHPNCAVCDKPAKTVHHKIPVHIDKSKELRIDNLITLCSHCHLIFGHLKSFYSYNNNIDNDSLIWKLRIQNRPKK